MWVFPIPNTKLETMRRITTPGGICPTPDRFVGHTGSTVPEVKEIKKKPTSSVFLRFSGHFEFWNIVTSYLLSVWIYWISNIGYEISHISDIHINNLRIGNCTSTIYMMLYHIITFYMHTIIYFNYKLGTSTIYFL